MSAANVPEGLKSITPYLQRAAQLQGREPIVSYYANYYAAKLAIPKAGQDASNRAFKQRKEIGENEAISSDLVGYAHIENFALKIFSRADDEDRAGQGSQKTAKNFVAAANFLELLKVFGDIDSEAAEIVKALRDGRTPPLPPGADKPKEEIITDASASANLTGLESSLDMLGGDNKVNNNDLDNTNVTSAFTPILPLLCPILIYDNNASVWIPNNLQFPSPPLGPSSTSGSNVGGGNALNGTFTDSNNNNWSQASHSPNPTFGQNQSQNIYQPAAAPPSQTSIPSTFNPTAANINSPPTSGHITGPSDTQYGYGVGNNQPHSSGPYQQQPTVSHMNTPSPNSYVQPSSGFSQPSAPYQHQPHSQTQPQPQPHLHPQSQPLQAPSLKSHTHLSRWFWTLLSIPKFRSIVKWTVSALTYDDIPTAIDNLEKALALLRPYHNK
ncbi:Vta1 like-domain-containing protein [Lobosporangium transversale]|uniref:Vta1 like-domain-containing protein n=1 Tax=Lobosporangium transversale TaxID=64571 RepID=A0A1Y2GJM7_9FUNG|nr:Vta1 like-domain-containing protein [Lobosporangium transversale]ORZ11655.1 Vta1 like-domain-containing protein [Lobosporangium transversale]|eukprot:XP_021879752.1 Vta1 like-domain-containing protein [Lobosporangium transversale]